MAEARSTEQSGKEKPENSKKIHSFQIGESLYMKEHFSDIIITLTENETVWRFPAHSIVLAASSEVFEKMIFDDFIGKRKREIRLQGMKPQTLKRFLRYMHFGDPNLEDWQEALDLLKVGHKYRMEPLVETCSQYLQQHIDISNVCCIYRKTAKFSLVNLSEICLEVIRSTACIVLRCHEFEFFEEELVSALISSPSLNVDSEMCIINALLRWAATQCCRRNKSLTEENVAHVMIPFLKYINTESINTDELATLPKFMHTDKNVFSRQAFCVTQHLKAYANNVNFEVIYYTGSNYLPYNVNNTTFFTFFVDYPLFLIGVNLIYVDALYKDDYMVLCSKTANVTSTVYDCPMENGVIETKPFKGACNSSSGLVQTMEVSLDKPVLLQPHTVYSLGILSRTYRTHLSKSASFPKTGLMNINGISNSAPFNICTDSIWGVTNLLYLSAPIPDDSYF